MPLEIVPVEEIERRARQAYANGQGADSCPFNWHSHAYHTWNDAYRRAAEDDSARTFSRRES